MPLPLPAREGERSRSSFNSASSVSLVFHALFAWDFGWLLDLSLFLFLRLDVDDEFSFFLFFSSLVTVITFFPLVTLLSLSLSPSLFFLS